MRAFRPLRGGRRVQLATAKSKREVDLRGVGTFGAFSTSVKAAEVNWADTPGSNLERFP